MTLVELLLIVGLVLGGSTFAGFVWFLLEQLFKRRTDVYFHYREDDDEIRFY